MGNQEIVDRDKILTSDSKDYGFDKILRGYDPKQVNEYITNLTKANKQASLQFDQRLADARNDAEMLQCELDQTKASLKQMSDLFNEVSSQRDDLKMASVKASQANTVDATQLKETQEKLVSQVTQNRLLKEENKKLQENIANLQRDVAHLTKKADKNRFEIKNLQQQLEEGMSDDTQQQFSELSKIYEASIDKAEDLVFRIQTEFSLAHSKAEDVRDKAKEQKELKEQQKKQQQEQQEEQQEQE